MNLLKDEIYRNQYNITIKSLFSALYKEETEQYQNEVEHTKENIERKLKIIKESLQVAAKEVLPKKTRKMKISG